MTIRNALLLLIPASFLLAACDTMGGDASFRDPLATPVDAITEPTDGALNEGGVE